jgi:hypothetical protein
MGKVEGILLRYASIAFLNEKFPSLRCGDLHPEQSTVFARRTDREAVCSSTICVAVASG